MEVTDIKKIGVVGAGTMGQGIAISCALAGYSVLLYDIDSNSCDKALYLIQSALNKSVEKGKLTQSLSDDSFKRIKKASLLSELRVDLVIEAVIENLEAKQRLFLELEQINKSKAILATNTSSISITELASVLKNPSHCVGLHFFNPAHIMKLVEVISGTSTSKEVVSLMKDFSKTIDKISVDVKDSPGFIVNRVARHFYVESLKVLEDKIVTHDVIDQLMKSSGFKMGPFELMDLIGIDVNYAVTKSVYEDFNKASKFKPSPIQFQKITEGYLGRKSGKGFYEYSKK
jgi:3-hydroxybutyryl-CoA dehydrogenase